MKTPSAAAALLLALAACASARQVSVSRGTGATQGFPVVVTLTDATPSSERVVFVVAEAYAVGEDGTEAPLEPAAPQGAGDDPARPRTWLEGFVPPGQYKGLRVTIGSASRPLPGGEVPLDVAGESASIPVPFVVSPRAGAVVVASLRSAVSSDDPSRFDPAFAAAAPRRIAAGLFGVATVAGWEGVALFDKRQGDLVAVLPTGRRPSGIAVDPERGRAYVTVAGDDAVAVIDLLEGTVRERIDLRAGDEPADVAISPDGAVLAVANPGSDTVAFVDTAARIEIDRVAVGGRPVSLIMDRRGRRALVVGERASAVTVIDVATRSVAGALACESGPVIARFGDRDQGVVYVAHRDSPYLTVHDAASFGTVGRVRVGARAAALEVDPRSGRLFLAREGTGKIEVFDPSSFLPVDEIRVPGEVAYLSIESEGNALGVLLRDAREIRTIGIVTRRVVSRTALGEAPSSLKFVEGR